MKKFINQALAGILALSCMTLPVSAEYETDPEETSPTWAEESESEENAAAESEEAVLVEEESPEGQGTEEAETAEEALPEETEVIEEDLPEETTVPEEETAEPEEVSLITLDPVSYNGLTISVSYDSDTFGGKTVEMTVGDPGEAENAALEDLGQFKAVDITFVDEEGNPVQPEEGKSVSVVLKAEEMEGADDYKVVHVEGNGQISFLDADVSSSNTVTKKVKTGETTTIVTVPEETEKVLVNDYKDEPYNTFEIQKQEVEVPAIIGYRFVRKSKVVKTGNSNKGLGKNTSKSTARVLYYLELEPYEIRAAYTKIVNVRVPVTKSRKVLVGSHYEIKVVKEAYTYEKTEDVYSDVTYSDVEASFTAGSFSVYAIVVVDPDGGIDYDETFGSEHITVKAPAGAFAEGTVMKIEMQDDPEVLANALKALEDNSYSFHAIDISFWKDEAEVEPRLPVEVTWTSDNIKEGDRLVHIKDDGTAELVSATVEDNKAVFTARDFSTYTTTRLNEINLADATEIKFASTSGEDITKPAKMDSGYLSNTAPEIAGYTFKNATVVRGSAEDTTDPVVYLGAFIYEERDSEGNYIDSEGNIVSEPPTYIYYRTQKDINNSDLIVKLADDEMIKLNYEATPLTVKYRVVYNSRTYDLDVPADVAALQTALGDDYSGLSLIGPDAIAPNTPYEKAVTASIPRGYSATVALTSGSVGSLGDEPTYSATRDTVTKSGEYKLDDVFTIPAQTTSQVVTLNLTKRTSYTYDVGKVLYTKYFGGGSTARYKDSSIAGYSSTSSRTFTGNQAAWIFSTTRPSGGTCWIMDSLEVNGEAVAVPFTEYGSGAKEVQTTLKSGTVITVRVEINGNDRSENAGSYLSPKYYYGRKYTITASNCYENITISGGNLYNAWTWAEYMPDVLDHVTYDYRYHGNGSWNRKGTNTTDTFEHWPVSQPISIGTSNETDKMYYYSNRSNTMRFKVEEGYCNPQMAFVSSSGADLMSNVYLANGLGKGTADADKYYPIQGNPDSDGFYYFSVNGMGDNTFALLRIKASLKRYGVSYVLNNTEVNCANFPEDDDGGYYESGELRGYNVVDNNTIVVDKAIPEDSNKTYTFMYYTIDGDDSGTHYAPSQKIPLSSIAEFGEYDSEKDEYVIPFVAHWEKSEEIETTYVTARVFLDYDTEPNAIVRTEIPKNSSIYIDIDSETMKEVMNTYNWQVFYDEAGSNPFVNDVTGNTTIDLHLYSKFYVYHSSTGELELHTTKELENTPDHKLDITKLVNSGYLYGGYYADYEGAHDGGGTNLVKAAADSDNNEGTLTTEEIQTLHNGGAVQIATVGTVYDPATKEGHVDYWDMDKAFTDSLVTPSSDWYSDRGENDPDVATDTTGGAGTEVKVARAGIYYIKEVPNTYLRPTHITTYQRYDKYLRDFILLSTTDDENYSDAGFLIGSNYFEKDFFTDKLTIEFGPNYDETVDNGVVKVTVEEASENKVGYVTAYRLFHLENESNKDYTGIIGIKSFKPYWITPDGITVTGAVMRIEIVKDVDEDGIIRVDSANGEITFKDFAAKIAAFKQ